MTNIVENPTSATDPTSQAAAVAQEKPATKKGAAGKKSVAKGRRLPKKAERTTSLNNTVAAVTGPCANVASVRTKAAHKANRKKNTSQAKGRANATPTRGNKKAEVIAMMKRAKGATLPEIIALTGWKTHTVRGFVSILGSNEGQNIESSKNDVGERTYKIIN